MDGTVRIRLAEDGADDERLQTLTSGLRNELVDMDGLDVGFVHEGEAPDGSRALDVLAVGALAIRLLDSSGLRTALGAVRAWLARGSGAPRSVHIEIDGDSIELSAASTEDQERLVALFVERHTPPEQGSWQASAEP